MNGRDEAGSGLAARADAVEAREPGFAQFLRAVVASADASDLERDPAALEASLRRSYARIAERHASSLVIHLSGPGRDRAAPLVVEVLSPDMPFLVDSALGAVRAKGGTVRFFSYPVVSIDGKSREVVPEGTRNAERLSVLIIHLDPLPDAAGLRAELEATLQDVSRAVEGWRPMLERLRRVIEELNTIKPKMPAPVLNEAMVFLGWLAEHNFTFLGAREYALEGTGGSARLVPVPKSGLGILGNEKLRFLRAGAEYVEMTPQHLQFLAQRDPVLVTKANIRSRVHRRVHLDYVGIKLYSPEGEVRGEWRVLGLFTSQALATPNLDVPLIRRKLKTVLERSGLDPRSHAGKALLNVLSSYPRDELFQIAEDTLLEYAGTIADLPERPRVRVLPRIDRFDNFVSILVYVPRDRYDSDVRARIADYLAARYDGRVSAYFPHFLEEDLVRLHIIIGRNGGPTPSPPREELERDVDALTRSFGDLLVSAALDPVGMAPFRDAFPPDYQAHNSPLDALNDIVVFRTLADGTGIAVRFGAREGQEGTLGLKVYHRESPIPLSERVPLLEHFGFKVIDERTYAIAPSGSVPLFLHDMVLAAHDGLAVDAAEVAPRVEAGILAVWDGLAESDGLNRLVLRPGLDWEDAALLRALSRYLRQVGSSYGQAYIAQTLVGQPDAAASLVRLFRALHDPAAAVERKGAVEAERRTIEAALAATASLDEDRILRRLLNLIEASLRTNAFQREPDGSRRPALSIKFDCAGIEGLPAPRPYREIFVYSPRVEGVHLRFGAIARGGIRWSDRPEDFRTEVLGLVKAQQVKNAVIVPVGAKGGFVPKRLVPGLARDAVQAEGLASYKIFIGALLDITDNLSASKVIPPEGVVRRDGDDPYLVVAADKGTASFSDTANAIAEARRFWLADAFASGGSAGYDHKEMGITARGAWEAVKRHFREMDRDIQAEPFTVAGIGDMSGDVFGNGMLLSRTIRLVAAFDHRDIFIDPDPEPETGFAERQRLFALPRSSWQDYDKTLISAGGGVFPRSLKAIPLSDRMRQLLDLEGDSASPQEVMRAILLAEVDLMWFGGIGTYVRAASETDLEVGDRANDALRVSGAALRARVIGEGANLAMTQRGRIEYALAGGRLNTDAIDNSAGVNSSDLEVNIKIALGALVRARKLTLPERNAFLAEMTEEVAALCLRNNYLQSLAISLAERAGMADFPAQADMMLQLDARGLLERAVEFLPSNAALAERGARAAPLSRPELAVLLAYAKLTLYADLLASGAPDDPYLAQDLFRYFPETLKQRYPETISSHRLRREVTATVLANALVNRGGPTFVSRMMGATSASAGDVAIAYGATRDTFGLSRLNAEIDALDGAIPGATQLALYAEVQSLLERGTLWFLRNAVLTDDVAGLVSRQMRGTEKLRQMLPTLLPQAMAQAADARQQALAREGVPAALAAAIAGLDALGFSSDIVLVSERARVSIEDAARAFFSVFALFNLGAVLSRGRVISPADRFDRMALDRALANVMRAGRDLSSDVLAAGSGPIAARLKAWTSARTTAIDRAVGAVADLTAGDLTVSRLSVAAGLLSDLARTS